MGSLKKTKILKKKNSISNEKYPIAVSWEVEQRTDIYGKTYNGGVCFYGRIFIMADKGD